MRKETNDQQINVRLTGIQYKALCILGGPTEVLKSALEEKAGDKFKLMQLVQQIDENVVKEQKQKQEILKLIKELDEKEAEEKKRIVEEAARAKNNGNGSKPKSDNKKAVPLEVWIEKWRPFFKEKLSHDGLLDNEYIIIQSKLNFTNKSEVEAWLKN